MLPDEGIVSHHQGKQQQVFAQITDANELNLPGSEAEIWVFPRQLQLWTGESLFVPDTLWHHKQSLDPLGETMIAIPDSIFPAAFLDYEIKVVLLTAERERKEFLLPSSYENKTDLLVLEYQADQLTGTYLQGTDTVVHRAQLHAYDSKGGLLFEDSVSLPFSQPINPIVATYKLTCNSKTAAATTTSTTPTTYQSLFQVQSERGPDSLRIVFQNPRKLSVWYHLYYQNQEISRGKAEPAELIVHKQGRKPYFLSVSYLWEGELHKAEYQIPWKDKQLDLSLIHPAKIYPGQEVEIQIQARTKTRQPVANLDVLAYGLTSQFEGYRPPVLGDLSKAIQGTKAIQCLQGSTNRTISSLSGTGLSEVESGSSARQHCYVPVFIPRAGDLSISANGTRQQHPDCALCCG